MNHLQMEHPRNLVVHPTFFADVAVNIKHARYKAL